MRFAHISDLHALDLQGVSPLRFLNKRLAGYINLVRKRRKAHSLQILDTLCADLNEQALDHVVVTGDLTNLSLPTEFARARQALDSLKLGPQQVSVIPGNHDVYVWEARWLKYFERALGPYALGDAAVAEGRAEVLPTFPYVRVRGDVVFVACSTALPSPPPLADGWLGRRQLRAIEAALQAHADKFRVLLIHHPPLPQSLDWLRALRDRGALRKLLSRTGCELILHGHEHRDLRGELPGPSGPIPVIGVGSATYNDARPERRARYNIYTVERTATGFHFSTEQRVHDSIQDAFGPPLVAVPSSVV